VGNGGKKKEPVSKGKKGTSVKKLGGVGRKKKGLCTKRQCAAPEGGGVLSTRRKGGSRRVEREGREGGVFPKARVNLVTFKKLRGRIGSKEEFVWGGSRRKA